MSILWEKVFILLVFVLIGFLLGKKKMVGQEESRILSTLVVYVFLPAMMFKSFVDVNVTYLSEHRNDIMVSTIVMLVLGIVAHFLSKLFSKKKYEQIVYEYSMTVANYGFMGYALAESMFGQEMLSDTIFFAIPLTIYCYSYAYCILTKSKFNFKMLLKPSLIAIILGLIVGIFGIEMPDVILQIVSTAGSCMSPVVMLLTGIVISGYTAKQMLGLKSVYVMTALRLVVIPIIIGLVMKWVYPSALIPALLCYSMPNGMNTIVFPRLVGENCELGAGLVCVTTILSCITIPIILIIFS